MAAAVCGDDARDVSAGAGGLWGVGGGGEGGPDHGPLPSPGHPPSWLCCINLLADAMTPAPDGLVPRRLPALSADGRVGGLTAPVGRLRIPLGAQATWTIRAIDLISEMYKQRLGVGVN